MESPRLVVERVLRAAGFVAMAAALVLTLVGDDAGAGARVVPARELPSVLARSSAVAESLIVVTDTALDPVYRDWLAAERASGRGVSWGGRPVAPVALSVEPVSDPAGGVRVLAAAPDSAVVRMADSLGAFDSAVARSGGATLTAPRLVGGARAAVLGQGARAHTADSLVARRIAVFGAPSWETKFVIAALEERGWQVDARVPLSPDTAMVQGTRGRLDTARVAAVVALDRTAVREARGIEAFVRSGGGLVLGPDAAGDPAFARIRAGAPGARQSAAVLEVRSVDPRRALALIPVSRLVDGAVALERRDGAVAVAARRVQAGRVVQVGLEETWRWRMTGPEGSVAAHRLWWSAVVGSVAYRATVALAPAAYPHDAPLARMVARLGPGDSLLRFEAGAGRTSDPSEQPEWWLFALGMAALLGEWGSRRMRGAA